MAGTKKNQTSFKPGVSPNPAGRPPGNTPRAQFRKMIEPDLPEITKALATAAKNGDTAAIKIIYDRTVPNLKPTSEDLSIRAKGSLQERGEAIVSSMIRGGISPEQASVALNALAAQAKLIEQGDILQRIEQLEALLCPIAKP